jgi:hypothetical protein
MEQASQPSTTAKTSSRVTENVAVLSGEKRVIELCAADTASSDDHIPAFTDSSTQTSPSKRKLKKILIGLIAAVVGVLVVLAGIINFNRVKRRSPEVNVSSTQATNQPSDAPPPGEHQPGHPGVTSQPTPEPENEPLQQVPADPASSLNPGFRTYSNERFGFRIDYPQSFIAGQPPENGDGMNFTSPDGEATLLVSGSNNAGWTLRDYYNMYSKDIHGKVGYQKFGYGWFVVTWTEGDKLVYRKMFVGNGSENSFTFIYPIGERTLYDEAATKMEKSFRPGNVKIGF